MADYLVSGAGDSSYNGTYTQSGTYNSKAAYTNGSRWIFWETMGGSRWAMNTSKSDMAIPYEGGSSGSTPTTGAWSIGPGGGTAPAPTVSEVVADSTPPTFASASVPANGNSIAVALTEADSAPILPASGVTGFTVLVNGTARSISSATASGTTVTLNLASAVYAGDVVTVSYAPGNVTDSASNAMASFGAQSVTNNSTKKKSVRPLKTNGANLAQIPDSEQIAPSLLPPDVLVIALSDETTAITTGTNKATFRMPFALTLSAVRASLGTASSSGNPTFDINKNGTSILSTKLSIDASEKTSTTAATAAVISTAALGDDDEISVDIDTAGTGAKGAKITLIGVRA
jgi:hypothetical protein